METIDKARIQQFADQVRKQAEVTAKAIADQQVASVRLQGATAALDYILALEPIELDAEDEVTDVDVADLNTYLDTHEDEVYALEGSPS